MNKKLCPSCSTEKSLELFSKSKNRKGGRKVYCKSCESISYFKNKKYVLSKNKLYRELNRDEILIYKKKYRTNNKKKISVYNREYKKNRKKTDINYKLKEILRKRLWDALKGKNKSSNTMNLIGCDIETLKSHLEKQFQYGMTFDNHGFGEDKWHIDHIKPCSSFDLTKESEQIECFNYKNLQPLWQNDNFRKGNK